MLFHSQMQSNRVSSWWRLPAAGLVLAALTAPAVAAIREPPMYGAQITIQGDTGGSLCYGGTSSTNCGAQKMGPNPIGYQGVGGGGGSASASATKENGGTVRAQSKTKDGQASAAAGIRYTIQVAPKNGVTSFPEIVPLHVFATGATGTDGYAFSRIDFILNYRETPTSGFNSILETTNVSSSVYFPPVFDGTGTINVDETIRVAPLTDITVSLFASTGVGTGILGADPNNDQYGVASAYVDPVFTLSGVYADLFDVIGVPTDGTTPPPVTSDVPEPATWAMMLCGFGFIGAAIRRRRNAAFPLWG